MDNSLNPLLEGLWDSANVACTHFYWDIFSDFFIYDDVDNSIGTFTPILI